MMVRRGVEDVAPYRDLFVSVIEVRCNISLPPGGRGTTEWWKESALQTFFADKR